MTGDELAALDYAAFMAAFGDVFEHSPWIANGAWASAPFHSFDDLHVAMTGVLDAAGPEAGMALVRAHPDLAGKAALAGALTAESHEEQKASGLANLTPEELARFRHLNGAYKAKFGFPFVMAVRRSDKTQILAAFEARLGNTAEMELVRSLAEIKIIARLRLGVLETQS